ncbi:MAG: hypothetical protein JSS09_01035, partial [Verrucomicrobia bacterium]|nr:hypothetical protein [Verrucomicrobiota bacterium]
VWLSVFLILFICLVLGKDCISARILEAYLSRTLQKQGWSFLQTQVEKDHVSMQGISGPGVPIGQLAAFCHLSLVPFVFQPEIALSEVVLSLEEKPSGKEKDFNFLALALGNFFFDPKLRIEKGEVTFPSSDNIFSFQFDPGLEDYKLGSLYVEEKGGEKPFLVAELSKQEKEVIVKAEISQGEIFFLLPWVSSLTEKFGAETWDKLGGKVNAYIQCSFHQEKGLESLQANVELEEVDLQSFSSGYATQAKSLQGTISFLANDSLPFWEQMDLFLTFEDLLWMTKQKERGFGFTNALGEIRLQPGKDPYVKIGGSVHTKGTLMPFELEGSYELLGKGAYFLQTNLCFFLPHSQPEIIASFLQSEEGDKVLEVHWKYIGKEISDVYQEIGSFFSAPTCFLEKGEIEGKVLAKGSGGVWKSIELSDFIAKNIVFSMPSKNISLSAQNALAHGLFDEEKVISLQAEVRKGKVSLPELQVEEIVAKVDISEGEFMPSYIEGSYQGMKMAGQILSSSADSLLHLECGLYPQDLKRWFPLENSVASSQKDPIFIVLDLSPDGKEGRFAGTVRFPSTANQPQDMDIKGVIHKTLSRNVSDIFSPWDLSSAEGTFSLEQLSAKTLYPYQKELFTDLQ